MANKFELPPLEDLAEQFDSLAQRVRLAMAPLTDQRVITSLTNIVSLSAQLGQQGTEYLRTGGRQLVITEMLSLARSKEALGEEIVLARIEDEQRAMASVVAEREAAGEEVDKTAKTYDELVGKQGAYAEAVAYGQIKESEKVTDLLGQNELMDQTLDSLDGMIGRYHALALQQQVLKGNTDSITEAEEELLELQAESLALSENAGELTKEQLNLKQSLLAIQMELIEGAIKEEKVSAQQTIISEKSNELFGTSFQKIKNDANDIAEVLGSWPGKILLAAAAAKIVSDAIFGSFQSIRSEGLEFGQTWDIAGKSFLNVSGYIDRANEGLYATKGAVSDAAGALISQYGDMRAVTEDTLDQTVLLTEVLGMAPGPAAELMNSFAKLPGYSEGMAKEWATTTRMVAGINKLAPGKLFAIAAEHSEDMAKYGAKGADAFIRTAAAVARMGVDIGKIESLQDRVLNVDTFIQDITKLRTLGLDIQQPMQLAALAQAGDIEGFTNALKNQLRNMGREISIEGLGGATQARMFAEAYGMELQDLQRIFAGETLESLAAMDEATKAEEEDKLFRQTQLASIATLADKFDPLKLAIIALTTVMTIQGVGRAYGMFRGGSFGRFGRMFGGGPAKSIAAGGRFTPGLSPLASAAPTVARGAGAAGSAATGAGRGLAGSLAGAAAPTAGRVIGGGLLGGVTSFAIDKAMGEETGRAAAGAVGASILGGIGMAAGGAGGTLALPGPGTVAGGVMVGAIGSIVGNLIGKGIYDIAQMLPSADEREPDAFARGDRLEQSILGWERGWDQIKEVGAWFSGKDLVSEIADEETKKSKVVDEAVTTQMQPATQTVSESIERESKDVSKPTLDSEVNNVITADLTIEEPPTLDIERPLPVIGVESEQQLAHTLDVVIPLLDTLKIETPLPVIEVGALPKVVQSQDTTKLIETVTSQVATESIRSSQLSQFIETTSEPEPKYTDVVDESMFSIPGFSEVESELQADQRDQSADIIRNDLQAGMFQQKELSVPNAIEGWAHGPTIAKLKEDVKDISDREMKRELDLEYKPVVDMTGVEKKLDKLIVVSAGLNQILAQGMVITLNGRKVGEGTYGSFQRQQTA